MSTDFSGCLPFCVKRILCYYCLLSLWRNKYDDDGGGCDEGVGSRSIQLVRIARSCAMTTLADWAAASAVVGKVGRCTAIEDEHRQPVDNTLCYTPWLSSFIIDACRVDRWRLSNWFISQDNSCQQEQTAFLQTCISSNKTRQVHSEARSTHHCMLLSPGKFNGKVDLQPAADSRICVRIKIRIFEY